MSTLNVDKVDPNTGTALEIGSSGDTVTVPSGATLTLTSATLNLPTTITSTTEVKTNKISPATGVAFALGDSGDTFTVPSGATIVNSGTATGFGITASSFRPNVDPLVINGDMAIAQRGTSTTSNGALIDRWKVYDSTDGVITYTTSTESPEEEGFNNSLKVACSTADTSIAAAQYAQINYFIEGQDCQLFKYGTSSAETITLAFWIRSKQTGTFCTNIIKKPGSGTRYEIVNEFTVSVADTWEKKIITISPTAGSTSFITSAAGAIVDSNADGFDFSISLAVGTDYHTTDDTWVAASDKMSTSSQTNFMSSTSNEIYITGVQLEVGEYTSATLPPFQHETYAENLFRCQRYYRTWGGGHLYEQFTVGYNTGATSASTVLNYSVPQMRTVPTQSVSAAGDWKIYSVASSYTCTEVSYGNPTNSDRQLMMTTGGTMTVGDGCMLQANNTLAARFNLDAEF